ncbi:TonB-dependent receptor SusC [Pedobacter sp. Bi27]|uniref:TonB-dependent receptor plug domain-containing protein n=1 Tax=Pedobacter sp. Bi27 TaxID=2822351 RepID=UPI001DBF0701|nr:TonB-dependent receptor plug domain-containing protein [Pedobacter sp. Bi27]CAH0284443.1 TonB-dependent receptor SusC [Pedobacter sp. Bi27]
MKRKLLATSKCAVMFLFALILSLGKSNDSIAQTAQISISGKVKDTQGNPIPGASISVKGTTQVVASDANGNFKISAQKGESLVITFVGYVTNTILVANDTQLSIILAEDKDKNLQDVVVIGYGTQKRSDVTGSIVSVPKARLSQLPVTNVLQSIEGAVAGVNVSTTSSVPGSQPNALIRGQNSISATTGPYVVVDGVPLTKTGGSLNDINPNDIASVEVLKDASATAIYGTNGSNGVILITTKRGTTGKPVIRYSGYAGIDNIAHILQPGSGADYVQKYADMLKQTGQVQQRPVPNIGELPAYNAGTTTDWLKKQPNKG